ncbi:GTPase domain-containing protein [Microbacterium terregens]|uniref:GTPase family protein n=1 Tax=Microbacterium terregens TaxID=69363 RepID=A0ABV5SYK2_9MICO
MANEGWDDEEFRNKWQQQAEKIGRFNLAIFGKTGVGKSTLINAIFGREVAATGIGEPVTMDEVLHLHDNGFLGLLDTRGLEIGADTDAIIKDLSQHMKDRRKKQETDQVHVAWYCVSANHKRFEDTEADFIRRLDELGLPVIVVLTQVPSRDGELHGDAIELAEHIAARALPIVGGRPLPVMAQADDFTRQPTHGLEDLLDATFRVAPEGVRVALTAAQKIDMGRKFRQAQLAVWAAGALAGATSVFLKDEPKALPTIVLGMTGAVAAIYGIPEDIAALAWAAAATAVTAAGGSVTDGLIALIPEEKVGAQDVVTGVVAGTIVVAVGYAWTAVCGQLAQGKLDGVGGLLQDGMVRELFLTQFKKKFAQESGAA